MGRPKKNVRDEQGTESWRKWYAKAWLSDLQVQLCSLAAKGLWIDMLNLMMESPRVGYLCGPDGKKMSLEQLARAVRQEVEDIARPLEELKINRVYSVDNKGVIFNRRIVREEKRKEYGAIGGKISTANRERDQKGRVLPWTRLGDKTPARERERERDRFSFENTRARDSLEPRRSGNGKSHRPWTLSEKRAYGHNKVAEALGGTAEAWELIVKASEGDTKAKRACKRVAKEIGVTWYDGKDDVKPADTSQGSLV